MTSLERLYEAARNALAWPHYRNRCGALLRGLIRDKTVLVIGSGPSAAELKTIPEGVLIFTVKHGLKLLKEREFRGPIDLFIGWNGHFRRNAFIEELLSEFHTRVFVTDGRHALERKNLSGAFSYLVTDDGKDNFYLKKLIAPVTLKQLKEGLRPLGHPEGTLLHASTGLRLLQYALYYGAKEIYVIGIDLNDEGYFNGERKKQKHLAFDHRFMEIISKKYSNVYSLSATSPITRYLPHRTF